MSEAKSGDKRFTHHPACRCAHAGYVLLGASAQCGRCARTIKRIIEGIPDRAITSVAAGANFGNESSRRL
jgi:hypothetical protein